MGFRYAVYVLILCIFLPISTHAQVVITEIMYDLEGSDSGREWIEVYNGGSQAIDLSSWRLYEAGVNHKLTPHTEGIGSLGSGAYAVIADNTEKFLIDNAGFTGLLFDSSFSLKQGGEELILRNNDLVDVDDATYVPDEATKEAGRSLVREGSGWVHVIPTPGVGQSSPQPVTDDEEPQIIEEDEQPPTPPPVPQPSGSVPPLLPPELSITAQILEREAYAVVGAATTFEGRGVGLNNEPLEGGRYSWSFGDGRRSEGQTVMHTYHHTGRYVVILDVSSDEYTDTARMTVSVVEAALSIVGVEESVTITNDSPYEINLSGWMIQTPASYVILPEHTYILPQTTLTLSPALLGVVYRQGESLSLRYPNGDVADTYIPPRPPVVVHTPAVLLPPSPPLVTKTLPPEDAILPPIEEDHHHDLAEVEALPASLGEAPPHDNRVMLWLVGLLGIVFIGFVGVVVARSRNLADEFAIIEEE